MSGHRNLITPAGRFNASTIATRATELWTNKQEFLSQFQGSTLRWWQDNIWTGILEKVWREASGEQTTWLLANVPAVYTKAERAEYDALRSEQDRLPTNEHHRFRELTWAMQRIAVAARERTWATAMAPAERSREAALVGVSAPQILIAA
jgi:hypothetical protein